MNQPEGEVRHIQGAQTPRCHQATDPVQLVGQPADALFVGEQSD